MIGNIISEVGIYGGGGGGGFSSNIDSAMVQPVTLLECGLGGGGGGGGGDFIPILID